LLVLYVLLRKGKCLCLAPAPTLEHIALKDAQLAAACHGNELLLILAGARLDWIPRFQSWIESIPSGSWICCAHSWC